MSAYFFSTSVSRLLCSRTVRHGKGRGTRRTRGQKTARESQRPESRSRGDGKKGGVLQGGCRGKSGHHVKERNTTQSKQSKKRGKKENERETHTHRRGTDPQQTAAHTRTHRRTTKKASPENMENTHIGHVKKKNEWRRGAMAAHLSCVCHSLFFALLCSSLFTLTISGPVRVRVRVSSIFVSNFCCCFTPSAPHRVSTLAFRSQITLSAAHACWAHRRRDAHLGVR